VKLTDTNAFHKLNKFYLFSLSSVDTRPGLIHSRIVTKKIETEKRHQVKSEENSLKMKQISSKNLEILNREEALNKSSLVSTNKGFNLMLKMGYQVGDTLGKPSTSAAVSDLDEKEIAKEINDSKTKRLMEPIKVVLKSDRAGLGQQEERKQRIDEINEYIKRMNENRSKFVKCTTDQYLENKKSQFQLRKLRHNLHKTQRICFQLDSTVKVKSKNYRLIN